MMNLSTTSTDYDEDKLCSNTTKWLCDSPQEIKNKSLKLKPTKNSIGSNDSWNQNEWESYPKPLKRSDKNQVYEWRKKAFESILSSSDHDDEHEKINPSNNQNRPGHKVIIDSLNPEQTTMGWEAMINNSAKVKLNSFKIMAPNVGKLSLSSCVEVHIKQNDSESHDETIKVLCSVDVLKMRSSVFQDILVLEEKNRNVASQIPVHSPWRSPIKIQQDHPHDAASFLVTLHEGRLGGKVLDWSLSFAKLSVNFGVDEVIQEYASIMANHFQNILSFCEENHWRSNPSILVGLRIAVVQRNKDSIPMISTGTVIKSDEQNIAIKLDNENSTTSTLNSACLVSDMGFLNSPTRLNAFSSSTKNLLSPFGNISGHTFSSTSGTSTPTSKASSMIKFPGNDETKIIFHPHSSIFWVQDLNVNQASDAVTLNVESNINGSWLTPDEIFAKLAKTTITYDQKKMFWEMLSVINQFSEFTKYMKSGPNSPEYIGKLLSQPEFKVLWLNEENIDFIPKKVMIDLIKSAYLD